MRYYLISLGAHIALITAFIIVTSHNNKFIFKNQPIPINIVALSNFDSNTSDSMPSPDNSFSEKKEIRSSENVIKQIQNPTKTSPDKNKMKIVQAKTQTPKKITTEKVEKTPEETNSSPVDTSSLNSEKNSVSSDYNSELINSPGGKIAASQNISDLTYEIMNSPEPSYPAQARKIRIREDIIIKTKFLVGLDGKVENIEILSGMDSYGFKNEVMKTLKLWKFQPIVYKGENIKLYFYKDFTFQTRQ